MKSKHIEKLRRLTHFEDLVAYLRDELDWPIEVEDAEEITFDYDPAELGIDPKHAVRIESIRQIRPLADNQPWGIFYVQFESKRLPVVVLRRILRSLVPKSRQRDPNRPVWRMSDLLFISAQGEPGYRSISFAHFRQREGRVAELRTFSWDTRETHFYYIKNLNLEALRWPDNEDNTDAWREQWGQAFTVEHRYTIRKSQALAKQMARQAGLVRDMVVQVYGLEADDGPLHALYSDFREALLHDLAPEAFADMLAQTVAYGLFSAATQTQDLSFDRVVDLIPNTNPFLKELLAELTTTGTVDLEELGVDQLVEMLRQTDVEAILQDFGRQTGGGREDPVVHFYELFLSEYDKEQKVQRGVFYTPDPIVSYIVRSVDYLLRHEFGLEDGLADTSVDPETGEPLVQVLDVATGTGTFLAHVIDRIEATVKTKGPEHFGCRSWSDYVARHLLPRLYGFELMMAPYSMAHMKLGLKLQQTGYDFRSGQRLRVYLTNALAPPHRSAQQLSLVPRFLSREALAADEVKKTVPISVVVGNPPYSAISANLSPELRSIVDDYRSVAGKPIRERSMLQFEKNIQDDYVKFVATAQQMVADSPFGIVGFVTNHSYLDGPTLRGMRWSLLSTFQRIDVVDLHGNSLKNETPPGGGEDKNVFDIQQGVAIALMRRADGAGTHQEIGELYRADMWGSREQKYQELRTQTIADTPATRVKLTHPYYFFVQGASAHQDEWNSAIPLTDIFLKYSTGTETGFDDLMLSFRRRELLAEVKHFTDPATSLQELREGYGIDRGHAKDLLLQRKGFDVANWDKYIGRIQFRPFDYRYCYLKKELLKTNSFNVMTELGQDRIGLVTTRQTKEQFGALAVNGFCGHKCVSSYDRSYVFPLWVTDDQGLFQVTGKRCGLEPSFTSALAAALGLETEAEWSLPTDVTPETIFYYVFAILNAPSYRARYSERLKREFPRIPLVSDRALFDALGFLGADLVALCLLADDYPAASWNQRAKDSPLEHPITAFVERETGTQMGKFSKRTCYGNGRVYLDTSKREHSSYFEGVPEDVWNFHIGGYQVLRRWLYERRETPSQRGVVLTDKDIAHYQRIVVALKETMRLMEEIDEAIDAHGGWPID